jgi:predicted hydrocarbon binding protein
MQETVKELHAKPEFWGSLIHEYSAANYEIVALHRKFYEDLLIGKVPRAIMTSECLCEKLSEDVPLQEVLLDLKRVAETSRIVNRMDIDGEDITIHHGYRSMRAVDKLKNIFLCMLESAGLNYDYQITSNVIALKHQPDVEKKIRELLEYVGVKDVFDEPLRELSTFLKERNISSDRHTRVFGRRIGRRVIHSYEKQYGEVWTADKFKDALARIDKIPGRKSEWDVRGSTAHYTVHRCPLADDAEACHVCRGIFRGAMHCAFRGMAELEVSKLLSHGDEYCEVYVHGIG